MTTATRKTTDEADIRRVIDAGAGALRAKDAAGVVRHHAPGFVQYSLAPPLISTGADAAGLDAWFATWRGGLGYELRDLQVHAAEELGFAYGLVRLSGTKTDGEAVEVWFRLTLGFRKLGRDWKLVHEHESVPFYMDGSYKAAVDLKP